MLISISLPNFNHANYIEQAIITIRSQSYYNWELIIVDDGSTDNSHRIINKYATIDKRIKPIFLERNYGTSYALSIAQQNFNGELILFLSADDYLSDFDFFLKAVKQFYKSSIGGYVGKTKLIDGINGQFITDIGYSYKTSNISNWEFSYLFLNNLIFIPGSSSIWRKDYFDKLGGFDNGLGPQCDYLLTHLIGIKNGIFFENSIFCVMRSFANSFSQSQADVLFKNNFYKIFQLLLKRDVIGKAYLNEIIKWFLINGLKINKAQMSSHLNFIFNKSQASSFESVDIELIKQLKNTINQEQFVKFQTSEIKEHTVKLVIEFYFIFYRIFWKFKSFF